MSKRGLLSSMLAMSMIAGATNWSAYSHPHRHHYNRKTITPSSEGHKEPTPRYKDKQHRKLIQARRNARRRRARR